MKSTVIIAANEFIPDRVALIKGNVYMMGLNNAIITENDGKKFGLYIKDFTGHWLMHRTPELRLFERIPLYNHSAKIKQNMRFKKR